MPYNDDSVKEITMLRGFVSSLKEELFKCRLKYQNECRKNTQMNKKLLSQIEELKCSERSLKTQVRSLTMQLSSCKKNLLSYTDRKCLRSKHHSPDSSYELPPRARISRSRDILKNQTIFGENAYSNNRRINEFGIFRVQNRKGSGDFIHGRSSSWDRNAFYDRLSRPRVRITRSESADCFRRNARPNSSNSSSNRSNSIGYQKAKPLFNPTAYIIEKQKKLQENKEKMQKIIQNRMGGRTPSPQITSYSDDSSVQPFESDSEANFIPGKSRKSHRIYQSDDENTLDELAKIDQRLYHLKQFMKDNIKSA